MRFGWERSSTTDSCLHRSHRYLDELTSGNDNVAAATPLPTPSSDYPDSVMSDCHQNLSACPSPARSRSASLQPQRRKRLPGRGSRKNSVYTPDESESGVAERHPGTSTQSTNADAAIQVADQFLDSIPNVDISRLAAASFCPPIETTRWTVRDEPEQYAIKAWELCSAVARQANQYFGHARFIRFISLCFFLIWESFSTKSGKASAREVNLRMREAGFEGTSRTLKSLRDETIFINQLVSSAEQMHGAEVASKLIYCIFGTSSCAPATALISEVRLVGRY
ncbi:hypothetical protein MPH_03856 [Macrophomina phaseolina MS6]|uniref:Uncharacterized protein n=1 Tax=Macrophomina phaseolina (strain MS6) TaxID=1126212 RepID=K2SQ27_MACPH|nr:hypothetical protein MPH_03856 [Macrophomina phaseolina MS6]